MVLTLKQLNLVLLSITSPDSKMSRLWGQKLLRVLISSPALPVAASSSEVKESPGDDLATVDDGQTGDGDVCMENVSPLTYGKVYAIDL